MPPGDLGGVWPWGTLIWDFWPPGLRDKEFLLSNPPPPPRGTYFQQPCCCPREETRGAWWAAPSSETRAGGQRAATLRAPWGHLSFLPGAGFIELQKKKWEKVPSNTLGGKNCEGHLAEEPEAGAPQSVPPVVGWVPRVWGRASGTPARLRESPKAGGGSGAPMLPVGHTDEGAPRVPLTPVRCPCGSPGCQGLCRHPNLLFPQKSVSII